MAKPKANLSRLAPAAPRRPLPPPPGPGRFIYAQDPLTLETTPEPVAVRDAVSVPINRIAEYLAAYNLRQAKPLFELGGDWVLVVERTA